MMVDIALDTNVVVGLLDKGDSLNARAKELVRGIRSAGNQPMSLGRDGQSESLRDCPR